MDEKVVTSMYNLKFMSRDNSTKFLEDWCKLMDKGVFPNTKQGLSGYGALQCIKMNKDDHRYIIREVFIYIRGGDSNAENYKT